MNDKIQILFCEGNLRCAPSAILEFHEAILVGGISARCGGWHEQPRKAWAARAYDTKIIYGATVDEIKTKISKIYDDYIIEYLN